MSIEDKHVCEDQDQVAAGVSRQPIRFRLHLGSTTSSRKHDSSICKTAFSEVEEATRDGSRFSDRKRLLEELKSDHLQSSVKKPKVLDSDASNKAVVQNMEDSGSLRKKKPGLKFVGRLAENKGGSEEKRRKNSDSGSEFSKASAEPALVEEKHDQFQIKNCQSKRKFKEQKPHSVDRTIKVLSEELKRSSHADTTQGELKSYSRDLEHPKSECESVKRHIERCNKEFESKKEQLRSIEKLIAERVMDLRFKEEQCAKEVEMVHKMIMQRDEIQKEKQRELEEYDDEICEMDVQLNLLGDLVREYDQQFVSTKKELEDRVKALELNESQLANRRKSLKLKERQFEEQKKEFESKEKQFGCEVKQLRKREEEFEGQVQELKLKEEHIERQVQELKLKENEFEEHAKELDLKEKKLTERIKDHELKERHAEDQEKEFVLRKKQFDDEVKELVEVKKKFDGELDLHQSRLMNFEAKLKEHQLKEELFESQVEELKSIESKFEEQTKELELKKEMLADQVKELKYGKVLFEMQMKELRLKQKRLDGEVKDLESKNNHLERRLKEFAFKKKQYEGLENPYEVKKEPDSQSSSPGDGISLQFLSNGPANEPELCDNDILTQLQSWHDPAKLILNILKNPIVPSSKLEDEVIAIDESQIYLLQQLIRLSPHIEPDVREEAKELALHLKASMTRNIENPCLVLGFLQILFIYGLGSSFNEDEVFKQFEIVAHYKQSVELFRMLGFEDKISASGVFLCVADFIDNLIKNEKRIEAVRFICAYKLEEKYQPIHLLQSHVSKAKLICENSCNKTKLIEMKVKAMDKEVAGLRTVLQCMSENKLQCEDLINGIQNRILELERFKASSIVDDFMAFIQSCLDMK
ncbi:hypothetical protein PIB30_014379 [Stylosanthes scabra]|uniref:FRIGIDA-like protein n=1 Tax=Stylosanthes scabra TaxID=79078 RepID=A0ABU6T6G6_9FABA|nr:hypothetical protein [Stylosanthes scabra]